MSSLSSQEDIFNKDESIEEENESFGPSLPPPIVEDVDRVPSDEEPVAGPALPPHLANKTERILGPTLPPDLSMLQQNQVWMMTHC
jgi:hypothetical protein